MSKTTQRFEHRWIVVTETQHVVKKNSYRMRSYPCRSDAMEAVSRANKRETLFSHSYMVDRNDVDSGKVIL